MTREERIEAGAKMGWGESAWGVVYSPAERQERLSIVRRILMGAFPELAAGTHWIAPMELTKGMEHDLASCLDYPSVFMGGPSQQNRRVAKAAWRAFTKRLNPPPSADTEDGE